MSDGRSYKQILSEQDKFHTLPAKKKVVTKMSSHGALAKAEKGEKPHTGKSTFSSLSDKEKDAIVYAGTSRRLTPEQSAWKTRNWPKSTGRVISQKEQMTRTEENYAHQRRFRRAWND